MSKLHYDCDARYYGQVALGSNAMFCLRLKNKNNKRFSKRKRKKREGGGGGGDLDLFWFGLLETKTLLLVWSNNEPDPQDCKQVLLCVILNYLLSFINMVRRGLF